MERRGSLRPHLLYIGGEDHHLRIPAMHALGDRGFRIIAAGTGDAAPFVQACIDYRGFHSTAVTVFQNRDYQSFFDRHGMIGRGLRRLIPGSSIDIGRFERAVAAGPSPAVMRRTLGLENCEIVITVTRLTRQKGIPALLKAAALVHKVRPTARFLLVGPRESEGPLAVTQEEIDRHAPYVVAAGPRSDIPSLLKAADVFAFPTEYSEGVPRVLLEAALAGLPIVTTSMPGCTDVVRDGWSGFLVPRREPKLLASRIIDLLDNQAAADAMSARAEELVRQEFGLDLTIDRCVAAYNELLDDAARGRASSFKVSLNPGSPLQKIFS